MVGILKEVERSLTTDCETVSLCGEFVLGDWVYNLVEALVGGVSGGDGGTAMVLFTLLVVWCCFIIVFHFSMMAASSLIWEAWLVGGEMISMAWLYLSSSPTVS